MVKTSSRGYYYPRYRKTFRRFFKRKTWRRIHYSKKWNYEKLTFRMLYLAQCYSTGTDTATWRLWNGITGRAGEGSYAVMLQSLLNTNSKSESVEATYTQFKVTGIRFIANPGNNNYHRNQTDDVQVWMGMIPPNKTNQDAKMEYANAVSSDTWFMLNPFKTVSKYIPIQTEWLNVAMPCNLRFGITSNKNSALNYSPDWYINVIVYTTYRGTHWGRNIVTNPDQKNIVAYQPIA